MKRLMLALMLVCGSAWAQADVIAALNLDGLKSKAKEAVNISLDASTLQSAGAFLAARGDEAKAKKLLTGLKAMFLRNFEFEQEGAYSESDLLPIRKLLKSPGWSRILDVDSKADGERTEIYSKIEDGKRAGMCLIAAEKKELTIIYVDGPVDMQQLSELGGNFGVPQQKGNK